MDAPSDEEFCRWQPDAVGLKHERARVLPASTLSVSDGRDAALKDALALLLQAIDLLAGSGLFVEAAKVSEALDNLHLSLAEKPMR